MRGLLLAAAALACLAGPATAQDEAPFLGASLTWAIDRNFRSGTRDVTFTLRSAWAYGSAYGSATDNPDHQPGDQVSQSEPFDDGAGGFRHGQRFGRLCFQMCVKEDCSQYVQQCENNDFEVQTHNTQKKYTAGIFTYQLSVPTDIVGILAYLTFGMDSKDFSLHGRYMTSSSLILPSPDGMLRWNALMPKASGATVQEGNWEKCQTVTVPTFCTDKTDCPSNGECGLLGASDGYGGAEYYGAEFLGRFPNGIEMFGIASTFVQLCCSLASCPSALKCSEPRTRVKNYYSPVASFPLAVFQGETLERNTRSTFDVKLKVSDYDGHILRLLPMRSQNPSLKVASIENLDVNKLKKGKLKFHDYSPAEGHVVRLQGPSKPAVLVSGLSKGTRHVIEVQDYMWGKDGIEDSLPEIGAKETAAATLGIDPDNDKPTATSGGSSSQVVFATYFQSDDDCPASRIPRWAAGIPTEIDCPHDEFPCYAALAAKTQKPASKIEIMEAPGFERIKRESAGEWMSSAGMQFLQTCKDFSGLPTGPGAGVNFWLDKSELCAGYGANAPCGCCKHRASCDPTTAGCEDSILSEKKCRFNAYQYDISHVGEERVMCFVATAEYCGTAEDSGQSGSEAEEDCISSTSCFSQPLCVRFNIVGRAPTFVHPTPLEANSQDSLGLIVPGRTDVPACLGTPLQLSIKANDMDANDDIRIFLDDELRPTSFFSSELGMYDSSCGTYEPFAGKRNGTNDEQDSIVHLLNAEFDSTITAQLNDKISWGKGSATQGILYTLDLEKKNGIETLGNPDCGSMQTCRQRLLNMNRIVCGYAYDNSRSRYARWVGKRANPDRGGADKDFMDDHSLGSYASARHCWRIKLQAPPVFVTNATGCVYVEGKSVKSKCTPFGHTPGKTIDTTKNRMSYANITLSVLENLDVQFLAFDPNPEDRVQLYVMEDPGIPPNMIVGRSICLPRGAGAGDDADTCSNQKTCQPGENKCECGFSPTCNPSANEVMGMDGGSKCRFCDIGGKCNTAGKKNCPSSLCDRSSDKDCECTGFCPSDLNCNRASLRLQWQPGPSDFGKSFFVCVVARDNSDLCQGRGIKGTTERGWYGEQQCMYLDVVPPAFRFEGAWIEEFVKGTSKAKPYAIYVGCTFSIDLVVQETSVGASYGGKIIRSNALSRAPADAMEMGTNEKGEKKMEVTVTQAAICTVTTSTECRAEVQVTPRLGSEGFYFQLCFSAGDQLGMVLNGGICIQDPSLKPCNLHSECAQGECLPLCFDLRVETCRYCIKDGPETLRNVMHQYMIETNWMRIWTLNADSFGNLGTECPQYFDCDKDTSAVVAIDNPELIIKSPNGVGKRIIWTGVLYNPVEHEKAAEIACRFRTSLKSMQHNNPHLSIGNGALIFAPGDSVCMSACDAGVLLEQSAIPACEGIE